MYESDSSTLVDKVMALNTLIVGYSQNYWDSGRNLTLRWLRRHYRTEKKKREGGDGDPLLEANLLRSIGALGILENKNQSLVLDALRDPKTPPAVLSHALVGISTAMHNCVLSNQTELGNSVMTLLTRPIASADDESVVVGALQVLYDGTNPRLEGFPTTGFLTTPQDFFDSGGLSTNYLHMIADSSPSLAQSLASGILKKLELKELMPQVHAGDVSHETRRAVDGLLLDIEKVSIRNLAYSGGYRGADMRDSTPRLDEADIRVLDRMLERAQPPREVLGELFTEKRIDVIGIGPISFSLNKLADEIIHLSDHAGLTHVALPLPTSAKPIVNAIVKEGLCGCQLGCNLAEDTTNAIALFSESGTTAFRELMESTKTRDKFLDVLSDRVSEIHSNSADQVADFLRRIAPKVEFIYYQPEPGSNLGDLEADTESMIITSHLGPKKKILVLGSETYLGREDLSNTGHNTVERSLMARLRSDLTPDRTRPDRTASVLMIGPTGAIIFGQDPCRHFGAFRLGIEQPIPPLLQEWLLKTEIRRDVAIPIAGTPLENLQFLGDFPNTIGGMFDVLVVRSVKDYGGDTRERQPQPDIHTIDITSPSGVRETALV